MNIGHIDQLKLGMSTKKKITFDREKVSSFANLVDDHAPIHQDEDFAKRQGFETTLVHGMFINSQFSGLLGQQLPGQKTVLNTINGKFHKPVHIGESVTFIVEVKQIVPAVKAVVLTLSAKTREGETVFSGSATCSFLK